MSEKKMFYCEACEQNLSFGYKSKHELTKKHIKNQNKITPFEPTPELEQKKEDCVICCESSEIFIKCEKCRQKWCVGCDDSVAECPFCRASLNRDDKLREQKRENMNWQLDQPAFNIDPVITLRELILIIRSGF